MCLSVSRIGEVPGRRWLRFPGYPDKFHQTAPGAEDYKNFTRNKSKSYKLRKITIFPNVLKNDMVNVPVNEYEIIIIDAGIKYKDYYAEANMCDKRYILGSACLWKLYNTKMEFYNVYNDTRLGGWNYLYFSGSEENVFFLKEDMNIKIINIPFIPNPLKVNTKQLAYIDKTVKGGI